MSRALNHAISCLLWDSSGLYIHDLSVMHIHSQAYLESTLFLVLAFLGPLNERSLKILPAFAYWFSCPVEHSNVGPHR